MYVIYGTYMCCIYALHICGIYVGIYVDIYDDIYVTYMYVPYGLILPVCVAEWLRRAPLAQYESEGPGSNPGAAGQPSRPSHQGR